jgi:hypothetical protein
MNQRNFPAKNNFPRLMNFFATGIKVFRGGADEGGVARLAAGSQKSRRGLTVRRP